MGGGGVWEAGAPPPRHGNAKLIVRNKVFECLTLPKIEVIENGKWASKMA